MTNKPIFLCNVLLKVWFVRQRLYPEQTKTLVFVFVFVLAHEQPISMRELTIVDIDHGMCGHIFHHIVVLEFACVFFLLQNSFFVLKVFSFGRPTGYPDMLNDSFKTITCSAD